MHACPNCGAPLPIAAPGEIERCPFCGAETREPLDPLPRPSDQRAATPATIPPGEPRPRAASPVAADPVLRLYRIIGIAIAVACGAGGLIVGLRACL
jgi:uncharacterized Zn finger protein (UPF0148 family)